MLRQAVADAQIHGVRLLVAAISKPRFRIVERFCRRLHDQLRNASKLLALRPLILWKPAIEASSHAHSAFEVDIAVANPVAKADRLDVRIAPFVKGNELMP